MKVQYKIIILGDTKPYSKEITGEDEVEIVYEDKKYKGSKAQAFKMESGLIDRWLFKKKDYYLLIFLEYKKSTNIKDEPLFISPVYPPNIANRVERVSDSKKFAFKSSNLLWRVMKYRGVKPAFRDEFKEPFNFPKIPAWAIIPVVLVILGVLIYFLITTGSLDIILKMFGGVKPQ